MAAYTGRPGVDWGAVAQAVGVDARLQAQEEARRTDAIRWQGQQDYQTLIDSGVDPAEALRRSSSKLFFNDPRGQAAVMGATRPAAVRPAWTPTRGNVDGHEFGMTSPNSAIWDKPITPPSEKTLKPSDEIALQKDIARYSGIAAISAPGGQTPNPTLYDTATNNVARLSSIMERFNPTPQGTGPASVQPPSVGEFAGWEQVTPEDELPSAGATDIPATAENAAMLTRRNAPMLSPAAPVALVSGGGEVIRLTKDGRKAVFDAATKKFIRYAQ